VKEKDIVDWSEPPLQRWLGTITRSGTRYQYRTAFRSYRQFTGMTAVELIDEAIEDARKDPREKRDIVISRLIGFYNWLKTEYKVMSRGQGEHRVVKTGVSDKLAHLRVAAMRSFYDTFGIVVRMKGRRSLPKPKVKNKRIKVSAEQVKVLVDHVRTPRDRAIILTLFQGAMDASTLCTIKYGEIAEGLSRNDHPLKLELHRPKTGVDYYTFLGRDAVEAIKVYLTDTRRRGFTFTNNAPLFLQERRVNGDAQGVTPKNVQDMMREAAIKSGFVDEDMNGKDFNPLGPHALRESFGSIMTNSGVPDTIVDFWHGHEIGEMARAYRGPQYESLRRMYLERERLLSITAAPIDTEEIERKVTSKVDERVQALQQIISKYAAENLDFRRQITNLREEHLDFKRSVERRLEQILEKTRGAVDESPS